MTIALVAVVVILVGLPLAAVWWSRRSFWSRLRPGRDDDAWADLMRAHGLGPHQMARVENAVMWGSRLDDPRERAAVVELARRGQPRWQPGSRAASFVLVAAVAWGAAVLAWIVYAAVTGRWGDVNWFTVLWLAGLWWFTGAPRRAIRRNSD